MENTVLINGKVKFLLRFSTTYWR